MCQSCFKKHLPTYHMDENFRSYVDFPKGSYWIYEETITGRKRDSMYLFEREYRTDESGRYEDYNYDRIDLKFFRSFYLDTLKGAGGGDIYINTGFYYAENPSIYSNINVQYFSGKGGIKYTYDYKV